MSGIARIQTGADSTDRFAGGDGNCENTVILAEELCLYPRNLLHQVVLSKAHITCIPISNNNRDSRRILDIPFSDIVGCDCLRSRSVQDQTAFVGIYAYPHKKKFASKKTVRTRQRTTLSFNKHKTYEENLKLAERWKIAISAILKGITIENAEELVRSPLLAARRMLVLINPFSGPGKALSIFQEKVVPLFAEAGIHFNMVVTEHAGHATEIVKHLKLGEFYGIVIVSGDGLIFEVVNGLMGREDWKEAMNIPLGAIPGGSGNALCCAINHQAGEPYLDNHPLHSSFIITKHQVLPMDIIAVDTLSKRVYSFLSVTWGMVADVDIKKKKVPTATLR